MTVCYLIHLMHRIVAKALDDTISKNPSEFQEGATEIAISTNFASG